MMWGIVAALVSGALMAAGRDTGHFGWLMLAAPIPLMAWSLRSERGWAVFGLSLAAGIAGEAGPMLFYGRILPLIYGLAVWQGLLFALGVMFLRALYRRGWTALAVIGYAAMTAATEYFYGLVSPNGSFGALGYDLVEVLPLLQAASLGGVAALSFLAAIVPAGLAAAVLKPREWTTWAAWVSPVVAALAFGFWSLGQPMPPKVRVTLVSDDEEIGRAVNGHADEVAAAYAHAVAGRDGIIVLPEKMFVPENDAALRAMAGGRMLVAGIDAPWSAGRRLNIARFYQPFMPAFDYRKQHMVPGLEAEYLPGREPLTIGRLGVAICKDMDFAATIRVYGRHGVGLMLAPAWDFGGDRYLHGRMAVVRAVENGFALARSASDGLMTVSDSHGRIVAEAASRQDPETVTADVPLGRGHTLYSRIGDVFAQLMTAVWLGLIGLLVWKRR